MAEIEEKGTVPAAEQAPKKQKPRWKKVVSTVLTALIVLVLVAAVLVVVQTKLSKKPFIFGYATCFVVSNSMEPTIMTHDVIIVEQINDPSELKKGDIVTFVSEKQSDYKGAVVTHRIVSEGVENGYFTTRGDNGLTNFKDDAPTPYENLIGRYVRISRVLTFIYRAFTSKYGFLLLVFIPLMILLGVQVVNFRRACRMDDDGKLPEEKTAEEIQEQAAKEKKEKEDEIKRKAVEEYLASKKRLEKAAKDSKKK